MAGSAALLMAVNPSGGGGPSPLNGFITPNQITQNVSNGSWTSPQLTMNPSGGVPPYTYEWTATNGFTVNSPSAQKTSVSKSGFNTIENSTVTCKITDDNLDTFETSALVVVTFGNLL